MANPDLLNLFTRKQVVTDIKSFENVRRKAKSLKEYEIYNDNALPYVRDALTSQLSKQTADQMPIISNLNVAKAIVQNEANIYTDEPKRSYENITDADQAVLEDLYSEYGFNSMFAKANKYFKLRNQTFIQVVPKDKSLKLRVLHAHNVDVIPDELDPETAYAYIISSFDKAIYNRNGQDNINQVIADADDYKSSLERYQVWTKDYVFTMNGKGDLVTEVMPNEIGVLPFVDVCKDKDFEFFVHMGQALTDFTIDYNVAWSDLLYIARMQGYSVGVLSGDANLVPQNLIIGPNRFLFLPQNPSNPESKLTLDFKSPTPNIADSLKAIEALIATFLTTRGIDSKAIQSTNGAHTSYSSAIERLLAMIDQFRASKEDFDLFKCVESDIHEIVIRYLALLSGTEFLDPEYNVSQGILSSELSVQYHRPEMIETKAEQLANAQLKINLGIADAVSVLAEIDEISEDQAIEEIAEIQLRKSQNLVAQATALDPNIAQPDPILPETSAVNGAAN